MPLPGLTSVPRQKLSASASGASKAAVCGEWHTFKLRQWRIKMSAAAGLANEIYRDMQVAPPTPCQRSDRKSLNGGKRENEREGVFILPVERIKTRLTQRISLRG